MRRRLRLSNCLPRWAPTGSLPGCSHAKWLQMRGVIRCWLRLEQNLPGNLATCSSKSQWLSAKKHIKVTFLISTLDFGQLFVQKYICTSLYGSTFRIKLCFAPRIVKWSDRWLLSAVCRSRCSVDILKVTVSFCTETAQTMWARV